MGQEKEEGNIYGREDLVILLGENLGTPAKKVSYAGTGGRGEVRKFKVKKKGLLTPQKK